MVVLDTVLSKTLLQPLGELIDLALGLVKCITIVVAVLLAFLGLE